MNQSVFFIALIITLIIAGKYANKTIMNAVRIGAFILAVISLIVNWEITIKVISDICYRIVPFIVEHVKSFCTWIISNSYEISGKAIKKLLR